MCMTLVLVVALLPRAVAGHDSDGSSAASNMAAHFGVAAMENREVPYTLRNDAVSNVVETTSRQHSKQNLQTNQHNTNGQKQQLWPQQHPCGYWFGRTCCGCNASNYEDGGSECFSCYWDSCTYPKGSSSECATAMATTTTTTTITTAAAAAAAVDGGFAMAGMTQMHTNLVPLSLTHKHRGTCRHVVP